MKDLGAAKKILGMVIKRDRSKNQLWVNQTKYVENMLERFSMTNTKSVSTLLAGHFKLSVQSCPTTDEERRHMAQVPYANAVGCLMYAMICTRPDITHVVSVVSKFMTNPGKEHWNAVK